MNIVDIIIDVSSLLNEMKECNILNVLDIKSNAESLLDMYKRVLRNPSNVTIDILHLF